MQNAVVNELNWLIGGAQGSGVDSAANIYSRACAAGGLHVFGKREYYSNIKGEHSYFTVRVSERPIHSHIDCIDMLVSFDAETIFRHFIYITRGGGIIYDPELAETRLDEVPTLDHQAAERIQKTLEGEGLGLTVKDAIDFAARKGAVAFPVPFMPLLQEFAQKVNEPGLSKLTRMVNVMALSASMAILGFEPSVLDRAIRYIFRTKK